MAGKGQPGPLCGHTNPVNVDDGTMCRAASPQPGSVSSGCGSSAGRVDSRFEPRIQITVVSASGSISSGYQSVSTTIQSTYEGLQRSLRDDVEGAICILTACLEAEDFAPDALLDETGYQFHSLISGLVPGLVQMVAIVGASTILGAGIGGLIGALAGGVGAIPGAVVGADLGFDVGMAALTWLGVAFLAVAIADGFAELVDTIRNGVEWAWAARKLKGSAQTEQIEKAGRQLARSIAILMRLILQAIVAYLLKKAALSSTRSALATGRAIQTQGGAAAADTTIGGIIAKLRASKFGDGFADWLESNWKNLIRNKRLGGGRGSIKVTQQMIRDAMKDAPLTSQQPHGVSLPIVQEFVDRLLDGEKAPAIKVDGKMLVDGNHRYIAARILGETPDIQPWLGGRPADAIPWDRIPIDPNRW